jgi:type IV pilus assembly protein PilV
MRNVNLHSQRGTSLIEVLVAMVVLAIGLLGLIGLQARLQSLQMESYQRAQALMLLHDMATRVALNRNAAASYVTGSPLGGTAACPTATTTTKDRDLLAWCNALKGAGETSGGSNVGAMVGGRGCIEDLGGDQYMITVAWQGLGPVSAPPDSVTCGSGSYDGASGTPCVGDLCRRVVTTVVQIATLT